MNEIIDLLGKQVLELLGKQVSFIDKDSNNLMNGIVTEICFCLDGKHQISLDGGDFYFLDDCLNFILGI